MNTTLSLRALGLLGVLSLVASAGCSDETPKPTNNPMSKAAKGLQVLSKGSAAAGGDSAAPPPPPPPADGAAAEGEGADGDLAEIAYAYSPIGKRDPFRSLFDEINQPEGPIKVTELQTFELDQLSLVAIVSRIATPYAMVEDPNKKGHTLTRGILIGKNWGRVSQITPDCVIIKEEYRDYTGRKVTNKTSKCLPKPEEDLKLD